MSKTSSFLYKTFYSKILNKCIDLFYYLPLRRNKIVLLHDYGLGYGDSPKYIAEALLKDEYSFVIVWLVNNMSLEIPKPIRKVYLARIRSVYELATAKVIVTTMKGRVNLRKKKGQFFIYIPHGQSGAKYVEKAAKGLGQSYIEGSKWHSSVSDLFLSSSRMQTQEMRNFFWYNGEIAEYGLPRNDIFFHYIDSNAENTRKKLNIEKNDYVVLYAPTFRKEGYLQVYNINTTKIIDAIRDKMERYCTILIRLHPNIIWYGKPEFNYSKNVIDVTDFPDIQELLVASDMLITDYSSTMFDFMLLKRPIFIYAKDIDEYQKTRGLKDWFFQVPFPICKNNEELLNAISCFDNECYQLRLNEFNYMYGSLEDGHATERTVKRIKNIVLTYERENSLDRCF